VWRQSDSETGGEKAQERERENQGFHRERDGDSLKVCACVCMLRYILCYVMTCWQAHKDSCNAIE
jgi:hypothetical protein